MNDRRPSRIFKYGCLFVGVLYVLMASSILGRGVESSMAPFGVPDSTIESPHYSDAITWVYVHMLVLGIVIGTVGWFAESLRFQQAFSVVLFLVHLLYLYLDLRTSDTALGNGLYKGPESAIPALIVAVVLVVFAVLSFATIHSSVADSER
jgi:hypothetical protein